ncbi:hypothetical protein RchiOBHm_Chr1g0354821 [Rosa chinensis]|uniref:Uncharacterized protein n=1 Tax=Rosa chinensis TaxID=74649 RepID=A0A2P6SH69_ROSCH|nr:hypothetical protein RchiOBHm_Chr1g0354821 [Rosa chinensis]
MFNHVSVLSLWKERHRHRIPHPIRVSHLIPMKLCVFSCLLILEHQLVLLLVTLQQVKLKKL